MDIRSSRLNLEKKNRVEDLKLTHILGDWKKKFLSQQFISSKYGEYIKKNLQPEETCTLLRKEDDHLRYKMRELKTSLDNNENTLRKRSLETHGIL